MKKNILVKIRDIKTNELIQKYSTSALCSYLINEKMYKLQFFEQKGVACTFFYNEKEMIYERISQIEHTKSRLSFIKKEASYEVSIGGQKLTIQITPLEYLVDESKVVFKYLVNDSASLEDIKELTVCF